jgi:hypothetical protein
MDEPFSSSRCFNCRSPKIELVTEELSENPPYWKAAVEDSHQRHGVLGIYHVRTHIIQHYATGMQLLRSLIIFNIFSISVRCCSSFSIEILKICPKGKSQKQFAHILRMFQPGLKLTYSLYLCGQPYCLSS